MPEYFGDDEIFGDDDFEGDALGADVSEIFGRDEGESEMNARRRRSRNALAAKVAQAREAGGVYVGQRPATTMREQILPFSQSFTSSESRTLEIKPQRMFRPERLTFASLTA